MHSLSFQGSLAARSSAELSKGWRGAGRIACALMLLGGAAACNGDDQPGTVALADSGSITTLVDPNTPLAIPTTVAVRDGIAWVAESQFDQYPPFMGAGQPGNFRIVGLPLAGGDPSYIDLPDAFYPEGITVSPSDYLFIGSVSTGDIYTVAPKSLKALPFSRDALQYSAIGMTTDRDGAMLWVCDTDPTNGKANVVGISTTNPASTVTHTITAKAGAPGAFCNDVLVGPDGALWITESIGGRVLRIPADQLMTAGEAPVWLDAPTLLVGDTRTPFGVNGLALLNNELYLVNTAAGLLYRIDPSIETPSEADLHRVQLGEGTDDNVALYNPDGVTALSSTELLIVENGLGLPGKGKRVVRVALTPL